MTCITCQHPGKPRTTLVDGRDVCTWCEDWRHECEARQILSMPTLARRRAHLYGTKNEYRKPAGGILQIRGEDELRRLEQTITALWQQRRGVNRDV